MKIGIFTALFGDWPLEKVARHVSGLGYEAVELPVWAGNRHLDVQAVLSGKGEELRKLLAGYGLYISALSQSVAGQLSMGPHDSSTDAWAPGMSPAEKVSYAMEQLKLVAQAASELEVPVVTGLIGSPVWDKWYIFPPADGHRVQHRDRPAGTHRPGFGRLRLRPVLRTRGPRDVPGGRGREGDRLPETPHHQEAAQERLVVGGAASAGGGG